MYRLIAVFLLVGLLAGCGPRKLSPGEVATEQKTIESLVTDLWKAYSAKDLPALTKLYTTSTDLLFFGTDSAEVIRSIPLWEAQVKNDWELFQTVKFGELRNVSILLSDDGTLGSIACETPADMVVAGQPSHSLFRMASALRKENGSWRFVHGMVAVATVGQSSAELVARMKAEAAMPEKGKKGK